MIHDVRGEDEMTEAGLRKYKQFVEDFKKSLYPHCEKYSRVTGNLKLLQLKAAHGCTDKSFKSIASSPEGYAARRELATGYCVRDQADCVSRGIEN